MDGLIVSLSVFGIISVFVSIAIAIAVYVWLHNCSLNSFRIYAILVALAKKNGVYDDSGETINQILGLANLGKMCYKKGSFEEALRFYDKALKLNPYYDANIWYNKGKVLEQLGKIEESKKCFEKAKELEEKGSN